MPDPLFQPPLGTPFIELQSIDSTNNYALACIHAGLAQHGTAFFAHEQVAGKGQRGKAWVAEKGSNLILSIVLNPQPLALAQQFQLSTCVAVSFCELFERYAGEAVRIKWPNDLYWHDRKAGGILIENIVSTGSQTSGPIASQDHPSKWQWAVAGLGLNINQDNFPASLKNPVSLKQITGKKFNTVDLARELCYILDRNFRLLLQDGFEELYQYYLSRLYKKNESVRFKKDNRNFEAIVKSVSRSGGLILQHAIEEEFVWGELEWKG